MGITLNSSATNNAGWKTQFEFRDGETSDLIDFTGATIEIEVKGLEGCKRIEATTDNGKISILDLGVFELLVSAQEMKSLCPATYKIGGVYRMEGDEPISLFTGTLTVIDGVARL